MGNPSFEDASSIKNGGFPASYVSFTRRVKNQPFHLRISKRLGFGFNKTISSVYKLQKLDQER